MEGRERRRKEERGNDRLIEERERERE